MTGAVILTGCFQTQEAALGPDETLNAFYRSICSGDFDNAESLCDTLTMQEYVGDLRKEWTEADSSVMTIVPAILSEVTVSITDIVKNGHRLEQADILKSPGDAGLADEFGALARNIHSVQKNLS